MHQLHGLSSPKLQGTIPLTHANANLPKRPGTKNDQKLTDSAKRRLPLCRPSKENLHGNEILQVSNSSSESTEDGNFARVVPNDRVYGKQCLSLPKKGYSTTVAATKSGASQHWQQAKENKKSAVPFKSISVSAVLVGEKLGNPEQLQQGDFDIHGVMYQKGAMAPLNMSNGDQKLLGKNGSVAKRKALAEVPLTTKKMTRDSGKQQTLHGFLASKTGCKAPPPLC